MKIPSAALFFLGVYCVCISPSVNCEEQLIRDGNYEHLKSNPVKSPDDGRVIASEKEPLVYGESSEQLPAFHWKNLEQDETAPWKEVSEDKLAVFLDKVPSTGFAGLEITDLENGQLFLGKLNRRSAEGEAESEFSSANPHSRKVRTLVKAIELAKNFKARINERLMNLKDLLPFKKLDIIGLPGHPVRRIIGFILETVKPKPEVGKGDDNLIKRLFDRRMKPNENTESAKVGTS